jgi:uncharacterized protein YdgA (DUF945 family)
MKKLGIALGVLLALVAVAAAALPWYLGGEAEKRFREGLADHSGANSPLAVKLVRYERGWLESTALHRVSVKADPDVYFDVHHAIDHLPDPRVGLIHMRSTPRWPQQVQAAADYYFAKQPALSVDTLVDFERNVAVRISSPAFSRPLLTQPGVKLTWGGAQGTLNFSAGSKMKLDLSMPRVAFEGGGTVADLARASLRGEWTTAGSQLDWQGETRIEVDQVSLESPAGGGVLKGIETTMVQRNQGETILVGYAFKVKEGVATGVGVDQQGFTDAVVEVEFDRLDKKALSKYLDDIANAEQTGVSEQAQTRLAAQLWLGLMNELLKGSPEMRIKQLGVKTADGTLSGSAVLGFDGKDFTQLSSPLELMARTTFTGSAEASAVLLRAWMAKDARTHAVRVLAEQGSAYPEDAQVQQLSEQLVQQQLAALEAAGLLKPEGDKFVLHAEFAGGRLMLNGNSADQLLGPMLAPPEAAPMPAVAPVERDA